MSWITLRLRVTTPLFNGHDDEPLRVSSLRGAMRYWFRALAGNQGRPQYSDSASPRRRSFRQHHQSIPGTDATGQTAPNPQESLPFVP